MRIEEVLQQSVRVTRRVAGMRPSHAIESAFGVVIGQRLLVRSVGSHRDEFVEDGSMRLAQFRREKILPLSVEQHELRGDIERAVADGETCISLVLSLSSLRAELLPSSSTLIA